jgi:hypothetical protein
LQLTAGSKGRAKPLAWRLLVVLVGVSTGQPMPAFADDETRLASDVLVYTDTDRVLVVSPQWSARRALDDDGGQVQARVVVDAVTAASVDVISHATYRFSEVRTEVEFDASKRLGEFLPAATYRFSSEPDYQSHGFGLGIERRLAGADTVFAGRYDLTLDTVGRVDTPRDSFSESLTTHAGEFGITQVIDPQTLVRVVYSLTAQFGYMEKPYRSVPLFDQAGIAAAQADGVDLNLDTFDGYRLPARPPESVPDDRYRHALGVRGLRYIAHWRAALRLDYRFYGDSFGIIAHTVESGLRKSIKKRWRIDAWGRFHSQSSASFWRREYIVEDANSVPTWRTMDRALAGSWHLSAGARGQWASDEFGVYFELSAMYSRFRDHLLITGRTALISQAGFRWTF